MRSMFGLIMLGSNSTLTPEPQSTSGLSTVLGKQKTEMESASSYLLLEQVDM